MNGYSLFYQDLTNTDLVDYEIESIFAFDVFIHNTDRRKLKPNFLIKEEEYCLIDHELSLNMNESLIERIRQSDFSYLYNNPIYKEHIFLAPLKKLNKKLNLRFENFEYHLNSLNLKKLDSVKNQLEEIGISTNDYSLIKSYIAEIKLRSGAFIKMLNNFF